MKEKNNITIDYYNQNAEIFIENTKNVVFQSIQDRFLDKLPAGAYILDFGCGSGRDTKYFLEKGFQVTAMDGSERLCRLASEYTGIPIRHKMFQELSDIDKYDGIWACASILHLSSKELKEVFDKMLRALKDGGILYVSFKYGIFEGERNGRYFLDMTEEKMAGFLKDIPFLTIEDQWVTTDARPERNEEQWLNIIFRKISNVLSSPL